MDGEPQAPRGRHDINRIGTNLSPHRRDGFLPIGRYAAIGDGRTIALVGIDGSIDWMCLPDLDAPSVFGALLDPERGGRFVVQPDVPFEVTREYVERTNVLESTFSTAEGQVRVTDALTLDNSMVVPWRELVRRVEGIGGEVPMVWRFEPRFDYGRREPQFATRGGATIARHGELQLGLQTWGTGEDPARCSGRFIARPGTQVLLVMHAAEAEPLPLPERHAVERRLQETVEVWSSWVRRHSYEGPWTAAVERSLLAIRLLADGRTGAIAAAGTTSLPEVLGGKRNYDYRYGWVRDASFTLDALMSVGMQELTQSSLSWLLHAVQRTHPRVDPVYTLGGEVLRSQEQLKLPGYRSTSPVHLGNQAGSQLQLGGFGDLLETVYSFTIQGHLLSAATGERLADVVDLLCQIWRREDAGLWELGNYAHYGTSKLGCWVAIDRLLRLVECDQAPGRHLNYWRRERDAIRTFIEQQLWSDEKQSYLQKAGSDGLDCGMLLAARRELVDPTGPRMKGTIDAIRRELSAGGPLVYRYSGMQDEENAFLACSFWMVEALSLARRLDEAAELMDGVLGVANDVGLYAEEMDPGGHTMMGNFPQALTHLALISAAAAFSEAASGERERRSPRAIDLGRV